MSYPGGGASPTSFAPVHAVSDHVAVHHTISTLPFTGGDVVAFVVVGLVCLFVGLALASVRRSNR